MLRRHNVFLKASTQKGDFALELMKLISAGGLSKPEDIAVTKFVPSVNDVDDGDETQLQQEGEVDRAGLAQCVTGNDGSQMQLEPDTCTMVPQARQPNIPPLPKAATSESPFGNTSSTNAGCCKTTPCDVRPSAREPHLKSSATPATPGLPMHLFRTPASRAPADARVHARVGQAESIRRMSTASPAAAPPPGTLHGQPKQCVPMHSAACYQPNSAQTASKQAVSEVVTTPPKASEPARPAVLRHLSEAEQHLIAKLRAAPPLKWPDFGALSLKFELLPRAAAGKENMASHASLPDTTSAPVVREKHQSSGCGNVGIGVSSTDGPQSSSPPSHDEHHTTLAALPQLERSLPPPPPLSQRPVAKPSDASLAAMASKVGTLVRGVAKERIIEVLHTTGYNLSRAIDVLKVSSCHRGSAPGRSTVPVSVALPKAHERSLPARLPHVPSSTVQAEQSPSCPRHSVQSHSMHLQSTVRPDLLLPSEASTSPSRPATTEVRVRKRPCPNGFDDAGISNQAGTGASTRDKACAQRGSDPNMAGGTPSSPPPRAPLHHRHVVAVTFDDESCNDQHMDQHRDGVFSDCQKGQRSACQGNASNVKDVSEDNDQHAHAVLNNACNTASDSDETTVEDESMTQLDDDNEGIYHLSG